MQPKQELVGQSLKRGDDGRFKPTQDYVGFDKSNLKDELAFQTRQSKRLLKQLNIYKDLHDEAARKMSLIKLMMFLKHEINGMTKEMLSTITKYNKLQKRKRCFEKELKKCALTERQEYEDDIAMINSKLGKVERKHWRLKKYYRDFKKEYGSLKKKYARASYEYNNLRKRTEDMV